MADYVGLFGQLSIPDKPFKLLPTAKSINISILAEF